ncbi:PREDICTED: uncharacterized protein LOC104728135 [Camelina sativa]|uniref:Uncharacterized protein LOC104728135 n=1 Tax=Camelina sativa TaxID=90675 RepID=A0ABM0USC4_CAMSA|nr:PREDICTED: uncharacterized protein LOC104728135 [Camelina sativa]
MILPRLMSWRNLLGGYGRHIGMKRCIGIKKAEVDGCVLVTKIPVIFMLKQNKDVFGTGLLVSMISTDLFTSSEPSDFAEMLDEVQPSISLETNELLTREVTEHEVKHALFMMHPDKAPGPDGMTALFYQKAWATVKADLVLLVNSFLRNGNFDKRLNVTNICLIAKVDKPTRMTELRPISLCNVGYKIISKVLCQRLRTVLPSLVSETQSAFVEGRLISDNILIAQEMFHGLRTNPSCKGKFMAIKMDISKAYDRVEWSFVENVLRQFGFYEMWITCMCCVKSVQYKVLLNGQAYGSINPCRGLRQGDPLSPYLFILCTEVIIAHLRKAERLKLLTGIKVSTASPAISHLLFVDDSLFFCRATKEQCEVVLGILNKYERVSGQQINFQKSSVQYSGKPGRGKNKSFSFVQDKLQARASGWPARLSSKGGKEVMIKSVATAVPTFVMSCFRLSKTVTRKLTSAISNFWWSSSGQSRGLHWVSWDKLCSGKEAGGLGFRCLDDYNTALLAKQLWRLIMVLESLFARVFKGRYYRHSDPLDPIKSYSPSYGWRSIVSARSLVNKGLITRVGSGATISVWTDPWIPAQSPRPALSTGSPFDPLLRVANFIDRKSNSWDMAQLTATFVPQDVAIISALPLRQPDMPGWHFTKSGKYSVKSGYHCLCSHRMAPSGLNVFGLDITPLQAFVWKIRCPPKLCHFMWQVFTGYVAVTTNLRKRGMSYDATCGNCGFQEETINHTLFECLPARQVWALSQFPTALGVFPSASIFTNMDFLFWRFTNVSTQEFFPWILWYIWKTRNDKLFSNLDSNPLAILRLAEDEAKASTLAQTEDLTVASAIPIEVVPRGSRGFSAPSSLASYICFVDGSWKATDRYAGRGWFCTSPYGDVPTMGAANFRRSLTPLHAEIEALVWAMRCMIGADNQSVVFLTDCSDLVKMMFSPSEWPAFTPYLDDSQADKEEFTSFSLVYVPRSQNGKADNLARRARTVPHLVTYVNNVLSY